MNQDDRTKWQSEPPTEPGWYFWRDNVDPEKTVVKLNTGDHGLYVNGAFWLSPKTKGGEWWRIKEPEE